MGVAYGAAALQHVHVVGAQLLEPQPYRKPAVCTTNLGLTASLPSAGGLEAARRDLLTGASWGVATARPQTTHAHMRALWTGRQ